MLEIITKKPTIADPSKSSLREEALDLKFTGTETKFPLSYRGLPKMTEAYVDKKTGEKFYKIESFNASFQRLLSLSLKGVINVSDVVKVGDYYYSHEQDFSNIESTEDNIVAEVEADIFIIRTVFGDPDHGYYSANDSRRQATEKKHLNSPLEHNNLRINETKGISSFFDFRNTSLVEDSYSVEDFSMLEKKLKEEIIRSTFNEDKNTVLNILKKKVVILINLFSDKEFERFTKIIKKSGVELNEKGQKNLFTNIRLRLEAFNSVLYEYMTGVIDIKKRFH